MDTSGTNLGKSSTTKQDLYTKEELSSILKFGAANIFNTAVDQTALEQMDLDDVINKAEAYDTETAPTGTSLGGEAFLNQFAVQDVKADTTSWDDIIPAADRASALENDRKIKGEASGSGTNGYSRSAAQAGAGNYVDDRGNRSTSVTLYPAELPEKKKVVRKTDAQRAVGLKEKDVRGLVKGIQKYGDIRYRYDDIVKEAKLESKDKTVILRTVSELLALCRSAVAERHAMLDDRKAAGDEVTQAMRNKATIVAFKGANNINAETTVQRADELKTIHTRSFFSLFSFQALQLTMPMLLFYRSQGH
jgi:chromodomain-helicase-DNA-binding protein 1